MKDNNLRLPLMLDAATYLGIATMSLLGLSGFSSLPLQLVTLGLCLLFGVLHRFYAWTPAFQRNPNMYFGVQTLILTLVLSLGSRSTDAFNFLFILLAIHTAHVLPGKQAAIWIAIYYSIVSVTVLFTRGTEGIYAVLFYLITYIVAGFFGAVLQQVETARDQNQQLVEELQATQQKLQELAVVEERNRLARDLHDSVKQQVFAISMQLSAARTSLHETDRAYASVLQAEKLAQQAGIELTALIRQLRPAVLEHKSLMDAIQEHVQEWMRQSSIEAKTNVEDISPGLDVEQALFRILQEALANVARHSQATQVLVTLKAEKDRISLSIEDNGRGYDANRITRGIGLDSMEERLAAVNGTLEISSRPSQGTCVTAIVWRRHD